MSTPISTIIRDFAVAHAEDQSIAEPSIQVPRGSAIAEDEVQQECLSSLSHPNGRNIESTAGPRDHDDGDKRMTDSNISLHENTSSRFNENRDENGLCVEATRFTNDAFGITDEAYLNTKIERSYKPFHDNDGAVRDPDTAEYSTGSEDFRHTYIDGRGYPLIITRRNSVRDPIFEVDVEHHDCYRTRLSFSTSGVRIQRVGASYVEGYTFNPDGTAKVDPEVNIAEKKGDTVGREAMRRVHSHEPSGDSPRAVSEANAVEWDSKTWPDTPIRHTYTDAVTSPLSIVYQKESSTVMVNIDQGRGKGLHFTSYIFDTSTSALSIHCTDRDDLRGRTYFGDGTMREDHIIDNRHGELYEAEGEPSGGLDAAIGKFVGPGSVLGVDRDNEDEDEDESHLVEQTMRFRNNEYPIRPEGSFGAEDSGFPRAVGLWEKSQMLSRTIYSTFGGPTSGGIEYEMVACPNDVVNGEANDHQGQGNSDHDTKEHIRRTGADIHDKETRYRLWDAAGKPLRIRSLKDARGHTLTYIDTEHASGCTTSVVYKLIGSRMTWMGMNTRYDDDTAKSIDFHDDVVPSGWSLQYENRFPDGKQSRLTRTCHADGTQTIDRMATSAATGCTIEYYPGGETVFYKGRDCRTEQIDLVVSEGISLGSIHGNAVTTTRREVATLVVGLTLGLVISGTALVYAMALAMGFVLIASARELSVVEKHGRADSGNGAPEADDDAGESTCWRT